MESRKVEDYYKEYEASGRSVLFLGRDYSGEVIDFLNNKARTLNYFKEEGLLPEREKKSKYSFLDLIWIRIISQLRDMGIDNTLIRKLKETAFAPFKSSLEHAASSEEDKKIIRELLHEELQYLPAEIYAKRMKILNEILDVGGRIRAIQSSNLMSWLTVEVMMRTPVQILLYHDGSVEVNSLNWNGFPAINFTPKTHVCISLTEILIYFLRKEDIAQQIRRNCLSEAEVKVLEALKSEKCKSVKVKFRDKEIDLIETEFEAQVDIKQRLYELILQNGYEDIVIKTQKGKIITCVKTEKVKINQNRH